MAGPDRLWQDSQLLPIGRVFALFVKFDAKPCLSLLLCQVWQDGDAKGLINGCSNGWMYAPSVAHRALMSCLGGLAMIASFPHTLDLPTCLPKRQWQ